MPRADASLIAAAKADPAAFAALYERHYGAVFTFVYGRLRERADAEDVTAQTFLNAWLALGRYEERGVPFVAWLRRIALNQVRDLARGRHRSMLLEGVLQRDMETADAGTERALRQHEQRDWMAGHLANLTPDQRQSIWLYYYEDRSIAEVAARLGRSEGAIKALLWRSEKALRKHIEAEAMPPHSTKPSHAQDAAWAA